MNKNLELLARNYIENTVDKAFRKFYNEIKNTRLESFGGLKMLPVKRAKEIGKAIIISTMQFEFLISVYVLEQCDRPILCVGYSNKSVKFNEKELHQWELGKDREINEINTEDIYTLLKNEYNKL
jgi:hypothetical protein